MDNDFLRDGRSGVTDDMERIFGPTAPVATGSGSSWHRLATARTGVVTAGIAGGVAILGLVAFAAIERPAPAPPPAHPVPLAEEPQTVLPARLVERAPSVLPAPRAVAPASVPPERRRRPLPIRKIARPAVPGPTSPSPSAPPPTQEAPHLTGEALRQALAEDVVITRRLNREALARQTPDPAR